jgi:hypothetical protein
MHHILPFLKYIFVIWQPLKMDKSNPEFSLLLLTYREGDEYPVNSWVMMSFHIWLWLQQYNSKVQSERQPTFEPEHQVSPVQPAKRETLKD